MALRPEINQELNNVIFARWLVHKKLDHTKTERSTRDEYADLFKEDKTMLPLNDQGAEQSRSFPIVNISIILLNFAMFAVELVGGDPIVNGWSLIPKEIVTGQDIIGPVNVAGQTIQLYAAP